MSSLAFTTTRQIFLLKQQTLFQQYRRAQVNPDPKFCRARRGTNIQSNTPPHPIFSTQHIDPLLGENSMFTPAYLINHQVYLNGRVTLAHGVLSYAW